MLAGRKRASRKRASLKKYEEQISQWAAEGKDDEWIAATLGSSASSIQSFRSRHGIPHYKRRSVAPENGERSSRAPATCEGVLERVQDEDGSERWVVWFDPAIGDAAAYQSWLERTHVRVVPYRRKISVEPASWGHYSKHHISREEHNKMANEQISAEDLDATVSNLENGVRNLVLDRAVVEISSWQRKLEASGEEDLQEVAEELVRLRRELENGMDSSSIDSEAVGELLTRLGSKVQAVADKRGTSAGPGVEEKLKKLGGLLSNEGAAISK